MGLGDLFVWESFLSMKQKKQIAKIYLAGSPYLGDGCELLFPDVPIFSYGKSTAGKYLPTCGIPIGQTITVKDSFPGLTEYRGSSLLSRRPRSMGHGYRVIVPW